MKHTPNIERLKQKDTIYMTFYDPATKTFSAIVIDNRDKENPVAYAYSPAGKLDPRARKHFEKIAGHFKPHFYSRTMHLKQNPHPHTDKSAETGPYILYFYDNLDDPQAFFDTHPTYDDLLIDLNIIEDDSSDTASVASMSSYADSESDLSSIDPFSLLASSRTHEPLRSAPPPPYPDTPPSPLETSDIELVSIDDWPSSLEVTAPSDTGSNDGIVVAVREEDAVSSDDDDDLFI